MLREIETNLVEEQSLNPASIAATTNGASADLQDRSAATVLFLVGATTTVDGTNFFDLNIEHSDDDSAWTIHELVKKVDAAASADADQMYKKAYTGDKRYVRASAAETGTAVIIVGAAIVSKSLVRPEA